MMIQVAVLSLVAATRAAAVGESCNEAAKEGCDEASLLQVRGTAKQVEMRKDDVTLGVPTIQLSTNDPFGPLTGLIGTWRGDSGYNLVAVPQDGDGPLPFTVVANRFREQITFKAIDAGVLNRGYKDANQSNAHRMENQTLLGLSYHLEDHDLLTGDLIHVEDGQWLWNFEPGVVADWTVARLATIPHGVSLQALGIDVALTGDEVEQVLRGMVQTPEWSVNPTADLLGYFKIPLTNACAQANVSTRVCANPVQKLLDDSIPFSSIKKAVQLDVKTSFPGGSLSQLPGIKRQVDNTLFNATFFIESTTGGGASEDFTQLQYAQTVMFHFLCTPGPQGLPPPEGCNLPENVDKTIGWPHVQVNTLTKVCQGASESRSYAGGTFTDSIR